MSWLVHKIMYKLFYNYFNVEFMEVTKELKFMNYLLMRLVNDDKLPEEYLKYTTSCGSKYYPDLIDKSPLKYFSKNKTNSNADNGNCNIANKDSPG